MLASQHIHVDVTDEVKEKLVELGFDPAMGARPLRRTIQEHIEDGIAEFYLDHPKDHQLTALLNEEQQITIQATEAETVVEKTEE